MTHIFYEDGTFEEYRYDDYQNKIYIKDRNNNITNRKYDEYGNLLMEKLPNGCIREYFHDENGNIIKEEDNSGKEILRQYDSNNNLIEEKTKIGLGTYRRNTFVYDLKGRITSKTDGNGNETQYYYDDLRGKHIKDPVEVVTASGYHYHYKYDNVGRNTSIKTNYGEIEFSYNRLNYVSEIRDANGNITRKVYDKMGNLISFYLPNCRSEGYRYKYDHMDRLLTIKNPLNTVKKSIRDSEGNIIKEVNPNFYDYVSEDGIGTEYVYDKDNRKIKTIYPDGGIERFFYDANGNVIKHISPEYYNENTDDGLGYSYKYNEMNMLTDIINEKGQVEKSFVYDFHGNIIKEIDINGNESLFKYDNADNLIEKKIQLSEGENAKYSTTYYIYDNNGNKIAERQGTEAVEVDEIW